MTYRDNLDIHAFIIMQVAREEEHGALETVGIRKVEC